MNLEFFIYIAFFLFVSYLAFSEILKDLKSRDKDGTHFNLIIETIRKNFHDSLVPPDLPFLKIKAERIYRDTRYSISVPTPLEKGYKNNYLLSFNVSFKNNLGEVKIRKTNLLNKLFIYLFKSCAKTNNKTLNKMFFIHGPKKGGDYPNIFVRSPIIQNKLLELANENVTDISIKENSFFVVFSPIPEIEKLTPSFFVSIVDSLIELAKSAPERLAMPATYPGQKNFFNRKIG